MTDQAIIKAIKNKKNFSRDHIQGYISMSGVYRIIDCGYWITLADFDRNVVNLKNYTTRRLVKAQELLCQGLFDMTLKETRKKYKKLTK